MMNTVFVFMGKSGVGKDTIFHKIMKEMQYLTRIVPITTRPPRPGEIDGKEYKFVTNEEFQRMIDDNEILEYRIYKVKNQDDSNAYWYYGHPSGKNEKYSALIGTPEVCENLHRNSYIYVVPIYIDIPDDERLYRMITRESQSPEPNFRELIRRYHQDNIDFSANVIYGKLLNTQNNLVVSNMNIDNAVNTIRDFITRYIERSECYGNHIM